MMIKEYGTYFLALALAVFAGGATIAQTTKKPVDKPVVKFKPPPVHSYLGTQTGKTALTTSAEGKNIISLPLKVTDDKNMGYTIASYQFAYTRVGITEDEATGKTSPEKDLVAGHFNVTPLPAIWQSNITENLHSGESLYFFDIIVIDKQGRRFFAPDLKITIQ